LGYDSYAFALNQNSPYTSRFSMAILKMLESGAMADLEKKWWLEKGNCNGYECALRDREL